MSTISQNLSSLVAAKSAIASAINAKGGTATGGLSNYASCIQAIPQSQEVVDLAPGTKFGYSSFSAIPAAYMSYVNNATSLDGMFYFCPNLKSISITNNVATVANNICYMNYHMSNVNISIAAVKQMDDAFNGCDSSYMTVSAYLPAVTSMSGCFQGTKLSSVNLYVPQVQNMSSCFRGCQYLSSISFDLPSAVNMNSCFWNCYNLTSISLDLPAVTNMGYCFYNCYRLSAVSLNLPAVATMEQCFGYCSVLSSISLDLPAVTSMYYCFSNCTSLTSFTLNLPAVESMYQCFFNCSKLTAVDLNIGGPARLQQTFRNCYALTTINLSLSTVTSLNDCFWGCYGLLSANFDFSGSTSALDIQWCFDSCSHLTSVSCIGMSRVTNVSAMFFGCSLLESVYFDTLPDISTLANWSISQCTQVTHDSLLNIVNALPTTSTAGRICTVGTTNLNKLTDDEKAIATNKGWTLN